jgi:hypothetical protein
MTLILGELRNIISLRLTLARRLLIHLRRLWGMRSCHTIGIAGVFNQFSQGPFRRRIENDGQWKAFALILNTMGVE